MAGDWIKMRCNLWDDPRVARVCDLTDSGEAAIVGGLYWLWASADQHSEDGWMPGLTARSIDRKTGIQGFGAALSEVGWVEFEDDGARIVTSDRNGFFFIVGFDRVRPGASNWYTTREIVFERNGMVCAYCGAHGEDVVLECNHVIPVSKGGTHELSNLVTACFTCNRSKGSKWIDEWMGRK